MWEKQERRRRVGADNQESVAEAEWDFSFSFFFLEGELRSCCDVGMWELHSRRPAAVRQARFRILILLSAAFHIAHWSARHCQPHKG